MAAFGPTRKPILFGNIARPVMRGP